MLLEIRGHISPTRFALMKLRNRIAAGCFRVLCLAACLSISSAATVFWTGGSGEWNTPANWSTGALPGPGDDVVIDRPGTIIVTNSSGFHSVKSVLCQEGFVFSGGSLTVSNTMQVNNGFVLAGGTLVHATVLPGTNGQRIVVASGIFDGVTVNSDLDAGNAINGASLQLLNGLILSA